MGQAADGAAAARDADRSFGSAMAGQGSGAGNDRCGGSGFFGGADAVVFTGGIGQGMRKLLMTHPPLTERIRALREAA